MSAKYKLQQELMRLRTHNNFTQEDVALALGYSTGQFISNWERGLSVPPIPKILPLARLYKTSADSIFNLVLAATVETTKETLIQRFREDSSK